MPFANNIDIIDENTFTELEKKQLLSLARQAIEHCVKNLPEYRPENESYSPSFSINAACFITLKKFGVLRGCIGNLSATRALIEDLCHNARAAALQDPRFPPVSQNELLDLEISISILTTPKPIFFYSEADLLSQLIPGKDGLVLSEYGKQSTFLPVVWESLPKPVDFLQQLKIKAGLSADYWSNDIKISKYHTVTIP